MKTIVSSVKIQAALFAKIDKKPSRMEILGVSGESPLKNKKGWNMK